MDEKYGQQTLIDIADEAAQHQPWLNQTLTRVNDAVIRLGVIEGEFHWHKHEAEDEFFLVLEGELVLELDGAASVRLRPCQGYTVPRGADPQDERTNPYGDRHGRACGRCADRRLNHGA